MDYNKMAQEVHEENKVKGFYDVEPNKDMSLLLIVSELMEMVEADRKGLKACVSHFYSQVSKHPDKFELFFRNVIKDTIEDEAADVILRILDYAGWQDVDLTLKNNSDDFFEELPQEGIKADAIWEMIKTIEVCRDYKNGIAYLFHVYIIYFTRSLNIDIWKHIELKRKYNKLRPIRNDKRY